MAGERRKKRLRGNNTFTRTSFNERWKKKSLKKIFPLIKKVEENKGKK